MNAWHSKTLAPGWGSITCHGEIVGHNLATNATKKPFISCQRWAARCLVLGFEDCWCPAKLVAATWEETGKIDSNHSKHNQDSRSIQQPLWLWDIVARLCKTAGGLFQHCVQYGNENSFSCWIKLKRNSPAAAWRRIFAVSKVWNRQSP